MGRQTAPAWSQHLKSTGIQAERQIPPAFLCGIIWNCFYICSGRAPTAKGGSVPFLGAQCHWGGSEGGRGAVLHPQLRWTPFLDVPGQTPRGAAQFQLLGVCKHQGTLRDGAVTWPQPLPPPVPSTALPHAPLGLGDIRSVSPARRGCGGRQGRMGRDIFLPKGVTLQSGTRTRG